MNSHNDRNNFNKDGYYFGYNTFLGQLLSFISTFLFKNTKLSIKKQNKTKKKKHDPYFLIF